MKRILVVILAVLVVAIWMVQRKGSVGSSVEVVRQGQPVGALVLASDADAGLRAAADYFVGIVAKSTGATLPVVSLEEEATLPVETTRIFIGPSAKSREAGLDQEKLEPETYRILTKGNAVFVLGKQPENLKIKSNPEVTSRPTLWALNHLLESQLGVRWLWPGELGTYVPKHASFSVPATDLTYQPKLQERTLRLLMTKKGPMASYDPVVEKRLRAETILWAENHQNGWRGDISFGHNFTNWWERFSKDHPDYFAELPDGFEQPFPKPGAVKLRLSNPAVIEQIAKDYEEAGAPKYWNICPNDGSGFDISKETLAWDWPQGQATSDILSARANLTARYVKFWNLLYERLRQINPEVTFLTYAYSSYRNAPTPDRPLKAKAVLQVVDGYEAFDNWKGWSEQGAQLYLRPNWWHQGKDAPYLPLSKAEKFMKFAWENRMLGVDMDSVLGFWGTQGPNYYLVARLMTRPDLTKEEILAEYTSAFGPAAAKVRDYFRYWEERTEEYNYSINANQGAIPVKSRFGDLVKQGKIPSSTLSGSTYVLPFLYTDEVLAPGLKLLDEAQALVGSEDPEALERVRFLRKGLDAMKATRDQVALGQKIKATPTAEGIKEFEEGWKKLVEYRQELSREHVVWGAATERYEARYHILIQPSAMEFNKVNLDGY